MGDPGRPSCQGRLMSHGETLRAEASPWAWERLVLHHAVFTTGFTFLIFNQTLERQTQRGARGDSEFAKVEHFSPDSSEGTNV